MSRHMFEDTVSEWLRRWTRNPLGSARRGSNPLGVVFFFSERFKCGKVQVAFVVAAKLQPEALLAQWLERAAVNRKVTGSIPVGSATIFVFFALWTVLVGTALFRAGSVA